jgi:hypothetical protein
MEMTPRESLSLTFLGNEFGHELTNPSRLSSKNQNTRHGRRFRHGGGGCNRRDGTLEKSKNQIDEQRNAMMVNATLGNPPMMGNDTK